MKIDREFAELIPEMTREEYKGLEESILSEGCRDALICWEDTLIDGHNRYRICTEHNLPYKTVQKDFVNRNEVLLWILKNQLNRRNLNDFQRIELVRRCEEAVKAAAKERQIRKPADFVVEKCPEQKRTRDELGAMAKVSGKTYERAIKIIDKAPEPVIEAVRKSDISINAAYEVTKLPEKQQEEISQRIEHGEAAKAVVQEIRAKSGVPAKTYEKAIQVMEKASEPVLNALRNGDISINQAYKEIKNTERKAEIQRQVEDIEQKTLEQPDGLFDVISMDQPWAYGTSYDASGRRCANPYPEMTQDQLKAIKLPASENCVLFLWTTHKFILDAKELIDTWGFEYRNILVWDKKVMGMGNLFRMRCEFCLVATKGKPIFRDIHNLEDIIEEKRREHSRKPEAFYELVNELCTGRKLDYFSRTEREGWTSYGNDTEKFRVA